MNFARVRLSQLEEGGAYDARGGAPRPKSSLAPLIASIKEHDLLQPLLVRKIAGDVPGEAIRFRIIVGNRRFAALRHIHGKKDVEIPVMVAAADQDAEAFEKSLAENVVREAMHPVDEYDAYAKLVEQGWNPVQIAQRFGVKEKWVRQRLQLASLSPNLRAAWRLGTMTADQAEVLSSVADHAIQEKVWKAANGKHNEWRRRPGELRGALRRLSAGVEASSPMAKLVGVDAYRAAGGTVREDLFADEMVLLDAALLRQLADEKFEAKATELRAHGWAWVAPAWNLPCDKWKIKDIDVTPFATAEEKVALKGKTQAAWKVEQAIAERLETEPKARAVSGVVVEIGDDGEWEFETLQVLPAKADAPEAQDGDENEFGEDEAEDETVAAPDAPGASATPAEPADKVNWALRENVSEWLTLALSDALRVDAHVAVAALAASLHQAIRYHGAGSPMRVETGHAWAALTGERGSGEAENWRNEFTRLVGKTSEGLIGALCEIAAKVIDVRTPRLDQRGYAYTQGREALLAAFAAELPTRSLSSAIDKHFDRESYFSRLTKDELNTALTEMRVEGKRPAKKDALVKLAVVNAREKGWLPVDLRLPGLMALAKKDT